MSERRRGRGKPCVMSFPGPYGRIWGWYYHSLWTGHEYGYAFYPSWEKAMAAVYAFIAERAK